MKAELKHVAYPQIAYAIGWQEEKFAEELMSEHVLFHILNGEMQVQEFYDGKLFVAGQTILVKRNHLITCGNSPQRDGTNFEVVVFILDKKLLQDYAMKNNIGGNLTHKETPGILLVESCPGLKSLFESLSPYRLANSPMSEAMKRHKLEEAILALLEQDESIKEHLFDFTDHGKTEMKEFILRNYMFNIPIKKLAELTGRSLSTFQRDFYGIFGMKASSWLLKKRLWAAHEALNDGHTKASEIYLQVGFRNISHFSKSFKKEYGYNPSSIGKGAK